MFIRNSFPLLLVLVGVFSLGIITFSAETDATWAEENPTWIEANQKGTDSYSENDESDNGFGTIGGSQEVAEDEKAPLFTLTVQYEGNIPVISLDEWMDVIDGNLHHDELEGVIKGNILGNQFEFLYDVAVVSINGIYYPMERAPIIVDGEIRVPLSTLDIVFEQADFHLDDHEQTVMVFQAEQDGLANELEKEIELESMTVDQLIAYLSFLHTPIENGAVSWKDSQLPCAPRSYRNGFHEGLDWYSGYSGTIVDMSTPILASSTGVVVRADHDYEELTFDERAVILEVTAQLGHSPEKILDQLRGMQVWVQYDHGVMMRYAHLSDIPEDIKPGVTVQQGDIIGYAGNSGTSNGVLGTQDDIHLHLDTLIYGELFWTYLEFEEVREVLEGIWGSVQR